MRMFARSMKCMSTSFRWPMRCRMESSSSFRTSSHSSVRLRAAGSRALHTIRARAADDLSSTTDMTASEAAGEWLIAPTLTQFGPATDAQLSHVGYRQRRLTCCY
jgi:hypothetical protein